MFGAWTRIHHGLRCTPSPAGRVPSAAPAPCSDWPYFLRGRNDCRNKGEDTMMRRRLSSRKGRGSIADMLDSSTTEYHAVKADLDAAAYRLASAQATFDACLECMRKD